MISGTVVNVFDYMTQVQITDVQALLATVDCSDAIQAAIDACASKLGGVPKTPKAQAVYFPYGHYLVTTPLNLTSDAGAANRRSIKLFSSSTTSGDWAFGTQLVFQTSGKAMVEVIDNDNFQMEDLVLTTSVTNGASVGVYQARRVGGIAPAGWTGNCKYTNVTIVFRDTTITQNNNFGTLGFINVSGEETTYNKCEVWANLPLAISYSNSMKKAVDALTATTYDTFAYSPVHAPAVDIATGASNTVYRTNACRFIAYGWNAPTVLLHEIGSYFSYGDFTQKRNGLTGANGTNGVGFELWNTYHASIDATTEATRTPILVHRDVYNLNANIRGSDGGVGQTKGLMHFGIDAPSFSFSDSNVMMNYTGAPAYGFLTYTTPFGVGPSEPAAVTLRNSEFKVNKTYAVGSIDAKLLYNAINSSFGFSDTSIKAYQRKLVIPVTSKSIGTPAAMTDFLNMVFPAAIASTSGFSATVVAKLHVSNAESETAGQPSSAFVKATWQVSRNQVPSSVIITSATSDILTSSVSSASNNITGLTLSSVLTGTDSVVLKIASIQGGANAASAFISGEVEVYYAGGYAQAPTVTLL